MNYGESSGEPSSSGRENGAASSDPDRPHKKARFPWQIKGKHHLKNQTNQLTESSTSAPVEPDDVTPPAVTESPQRTILPKPENVTPAVAVKSPQRSALPISNKPEDVTPAVTVQSPQRSALSFSYETNVESISTGLRSRMRSLPYNLITPSHINPITGLPTNILPSMSVEDVMALAENMLLEANIETPDLIPRYEPKKKIKKDLGAGPSKPLTARDARRIRREEEKCISRWQSAQTLRGCFDNNINRVVESWMNAPVPPADRLLALDYARIMNDLPPSDGNVENEGILMAIHAHGLQNVVPVLDFGIPSMELSGQLANAVACDIPICVESDSSICSEDYELLMERDSHWLSDDCTSPQNVSADEADDDYEHKCRCLHGKQKVAQSTHSDDGDDYNEYEFMNTAVIEAIRTKGLMAAGTDFG